MTLKERKDWLEYYRARIISRLHSKATASGFKQCLKRLGIIDAELDKLNSALKVK